MSNIQTVDVIVIGRSISGFSVAMNLLSANQTVAIINYWDTLDVMGTSIIFPTQLNSKPITGEEFEKIAMQYIKQHNNYIELRETILVESVHFKKEGFLILCDSDITLFAHKMVFAPNGMVNGWNHLPNIKKFYGLGVSLDAWSDAMFTQGSHVAIAGYGDRVLDQANWLAKFALSITLICPEREFSFSKQYQQYFQPEKVFKAYKNCSILKVVGEEDITKSLTALELKKQNTEFELECSFLFLADPVTISWEKIGDQEEISKWMALKKLFVIGLANGVSYSDHKALYLDGKRCASVLLKS